MSRHAICCSRQLRMAQYSCNQARLTSEPFSARQTLPLAEHSYTHLMQGIIFVLLSVTGARQAVIKLLPRTLSLSMAIGEPAIHTQDAMFRPGQSLKGVADHSRDSDVAAARSWATIMSTQPLPRLRE